MHHMLPHTPVGPPRGYSLRVAVARTSGPGTGLRRRTKHLVLRAVDHAPERVQRRVTWWRRGHHRFGSLRRLTPVSSVYGFDRGLPIDRYYIEAFLARQVPSPGYSGGALHGRVLEVGGREYVDQFATFAAEPAPGHVHRVDVLHANAANPEATIVGSLTDLDALPEHAFDCIVCTQTLHVIYDARAVLRTLHRGLRPGGTLLLTAPGITRSCLPDRDAWGDWWRFTARSLARLLGEVFDAADVEVEAYGNVLSATAFLYGFAAEELKPAELELRDPDFEVILAARARKAVG
jgi:SAM-dependent methyltransferase